MELIMNENIKFKVGDKIVYMPFEGCPDFMKDYGTITSVDNDKAYAYVFFKIMNQNIRCRLSNISFCSDSEWNSFLKS